MAAEEDDGGDVVVTAHLGRGLLDLPIHLPGQCVGRRSREHDGPDTGTFGVEVDADELAQSPPSLPAGFAGPVVAVGVEELDIPVVAVDFDDSAAP